MSETPLVGQAISRIAADLVHLDSLSKARSGIYKDGPVSNWGAANREFVSALERFYRTHREELHQYATELAQAQARLAEVEKDAARLDWLERENPIVFHKTRADDVWTLCIGVRHDNDGVEIEGKTLRAAINKALKGNP